MLGLGSIKDRLSTLGEGIKSQFSSEVDTRDAGVRLEAGAKIVSHYQVRSSVNSHQGGMIALTAFSGMQPLNQI